MRTATATTVLALALALPGSALAQIQPGPNLTPNGIPYTYSPRAGAFFLRRPPSLFLPPLPAVLPAPPIEAAPPPPPAYAPEPPAYAPEPEAPPQPLGWVFTRYTVCPEPRSCPVVFVSVGADGLNVRTVPDGPPTIALVNGTPLLVLDRRGSWTLVAPACPLAPTGLWSVTAGVPLGACP